jgi:hypothetical protein
LGVVVSNVPNRALELNGKALETKVWRVGRWEGVAVEHWREKREE